MFARLIKSIMILFVYAGTVVTVSAADYDESSLDSLFTDKAQRAQIDAARSGSTSAAGIKKIRKVKVKGYVTRSDGKSVVWINGKNTLESSSVDDVRVQQTSIGKNKKVTLSADGKYQRLKPGEVWHKETGKVDEDY